MKELGKVVYGPCKLRLMHVVIMQTLKDIHGCSMDWYLWGMER